MVSPLQNYCEGRGIDRNGFPSPELLGGQVDRNGFPSPELLGGQVRD